MSHKISGIKDSKCEVYLQCGEEKRAQTYKEYGRFLLFETHACTINHICAFVEEESLVSVTYGDKIVEGKSFEI